LAVVVTTSTQTKEKALNTQNLTYAATGINYEGMDPFKIKCQVAAGETSAMLKTHGYTELTWTRGESVYVIQTPEGQLQSLVEEGLGTKSLIADAMYQLVGKSYYDNVAQDTVAMIVNDKITLGVRPLAVAMHLAVSDANWFEDEKRTNDLIRGWADACRKAQCSWGCGETPVLPGMIMPGAALLSGSATGYATDEADLFNPEYIENGDEIVIIESSGVHANGLTMARKIASNLPEGYLARLPNGRCYGDALLEPTHLYVGVVSDCIENGVGINYAVNVTGHGWRKFMRAQQTFEYVIETLPTQLPIFDFIKAHGPVEEVEMYKTFNMGAGFALYVSKGESEKVTTIAEAHGLRAFKAGFIRNADKRRVIIEPRGIEFEGESLVIR